MTNVKTVYRVELHPKSNSICDKVAILACQFNGECNTYSLKDLATIVNAEALQFPALTNYAVCEIIGEHTLH